MKILPILVWHGYPAYFDGELDTLNDPCGGRSPDERGDGHKMPIIPVDMHNWKRENNPSKQRMVLKTLGLSLSFDNGVIEGLWCCRTGIGSTCGAPTVLSTIPVAKNDRYIAY